MEDSGRGRQQAYILQGGFTRDPGGKWSTGSHGNAVPSPGREMGMAAGVSVESDPKKKFPDSSLLVLQGGQLSPY